MVERKRIVDRMIFNYSGLFSMRELYVTMDNWFKDKGYMKYEMKHQEQVTAGGKFIDYLIEPFRKITDYAKNVIRIRLIISNLREVEVEREGIKVKLNQGDITMIYDAWLETDYENRWEQKPYFVFFRTLMDKFIMRVYTEKWESNLKDEAAHLSATVKAYLNLYRY